MTDFLPPPDLVTPEEYERHRAKVQRIRYHTTPNFRRRIRMRRLAEERQRERLRRYHEERARKREEWKRAILTKYAKILQEGTS